MADGNPDSKGAPIPPPGLRVSDNEAEECDTCSHFKDGKCSLYSDLPVDDEWVCKSWEKGKKPDSDQVEEGPEVNESGTMAEARVRVREHYRRLRSSR